MQLRVREMADVSIIDIEGDINIDSAELIETVGWLLKNGRVKILCNMENVHMVDYSGLSILAIAYKNTLNYKGIMKFTKVPLHTMELFRLVKLDATFEIYSDEEDAIRSFEKITTIDNTQLRRRFTRLDIHLSVQHKPSGSPDNKYITEESLNLSGSGIFIYTPNILPAGTPLDIKLYLGSKKKSITTEGLVVWQADKKIQPHIYPGMGIQFTNINDNDQRYILEFIEKNITHRAAL